MAAGSLKSAITHPSLLPEIQRNWLCNAATHEPAAATLVRFQGISPRPQYGGASDSEAARSSWPAPCERWDPRLSVPTRPSTARHSAIVAPANTNGRERSSKKYVQCDGQRRAGRQSPSARSWWKATGATVHSKLGDSCLVELVARGAIR